MNLASGYAKIDALLTTIGSWLQPVLLLIVRGYWGYSFMLTGWGKLMNLDKTTGFFTELGLPLPKLNAIMAGGTECVGGALLMIGLASRLVSVPLLFTMIVAYATAHKEELGAIFSNPDKFTEAPPFLFLLTCLIVLAFGPGKISVDGLVLKKTEK